MVLILTSIKVSAMWSQAYHMKLRELLDTYFDQPGFVGYLPFGYVYSVITLLSDILLTICFVVLFYFVLLCNRAVNFIPLTCYSPFLFLISSDNSVWLAPFNPAVARLEFRICHNIFCSTYKIQKKAFEFNEYVEKVFEKFILTLIEIRPLDWLLFCIVALLNWARYELKLDYHSCHSSDAHGGGAEAEAQTKCMDENARVMFLEAGK
jgi:hypothetical protein